ncbi:creatininase family protein [Epibacterium sp. SM1979]|uniref:Creatininase family protein n=1 Tax=Tritonibacter litoralis TaxID=2662264 RepID=A0A843YGP5_9RHOB|nr:creatininase family protein [Tritonibacter litoralis]MQQ10700.1 creatininase family protein [Tritonibacter litoralis]
MSVYNWAECRAPDFDHIDPDRSIAILPTAAIEQHGPHLPVGTDTLIMEGMLATFRRSCPDDLEAWVLPVQAVGKSNEHLWAKGTLTLSAASALEVWTEIGLSIARAGFRKLVIVNSHGGNLDLISILSRELRIQAGMLAVKCQWGSFGHPEGLFTEEERRYGIHGGDVETSLMRSFFPDTVDMTQAQNFKSAAMTDPISPIGPVSRGWIASDLNPDGTVGDASLATAEKGAATAQHQVAGFIDLLHKVRDISPPHMPATL